MLRSGYLGLMHRPSFDDLQEVRFGGDDGWPLVAFSTGTRSPAAQVLVLMHGGGPDHRSLVPLARLLNDETLVVLPDVRGYGRSRCADPGRHTWAQYADDVVALLDELGVERAVVGGAGLGATVALKVAQRHRQRLSGLVLISVEDIEDDEAKQAEIAFMDAFAQRMEHEGVEAAWEPILGALSPVIGAMVREAMPDVDRASAVAAAAIGRDRAFRSPDELYGIDVPTLIFAGGDWRHPARLARDLAAHLARGRLGDAVMGEDLLSAGDFARAFAPELAAFLQEVRRQG